MSFLWASRAWVILFSERTVSTLAIAFLTAYAQQLAEGKAAYSDLGKLDLGLGGDLGDTEGGEIPALSGELVSKSFLVFASKFVGFDSLHFA